MRLVFAVLFLSMFLGGANALAVDWSRVPGRQVVLFYPGQASWEWAMRPMDHSGAVRLRDGRSCRSCHDGEEQLQGRQIVRGLKLEPRPLPDKPGHVVAMVKVAVERQSLLVRVDFDEGLQPNAGMDVDYPTKLTLMLGPASHPDLKRAGCWVACHDESEGMPDQKPHRSMFVTQFPSDSLEYWQARLRPHERGEVKSGLLNFGRQAAKPSRVEMVAGGGKTTWNVVFSRPLQAGPPLRDLTMGEIYMFGLAVHSGYTNERFHYVSYEYSLSLGAGNADFIVP